VDRVRLHACDQRRGCIELSQKADGSQYGVIASGARLLSYLYRRRRLEEAAGVEVRAPGFPAEMVDDEPEAPGYEVDAFARYADAR
jgi:hypothetical protein